MAKISKRQAEVFDRHLDGVYGHFKTRESFKLDYLLGSIRTEKLGHLATASEALDLELIEFDELVQRDIDFVRVHREIVGKYLKQGGGRVIFFPPLMVTLIGIEQGRPIKNYSNVVQVIEGEEFVTTYDKNRFQVRLNITDQETPHTVVHEGKVLHYLNYAATVRYNSDKVRLVVLDGQHRLMALKKMMDGPAKDLVAGIDVPICVFFAPDARKDTRSNESLVDDMRELFVRINEEAKKVSGHFIWLLKDRSLAATAVRSLGDVWKKRGSPLSFLHQLEWNQREHKLASQTTRPYTITTVSVIAETLEQFVFRGSADHKSSYTSALLKLEEIETKLCTGPDSLVAESISEERFDADQLVPLKSQIEKYVTPSLDILFRTPSPYQLLRKAFEQAVKKLDDSIAEGTRGASQFKAEVLCKFRRTNDLDQEPVKGMEAVFDDMFDDEELHAVDFFRRNIFQQGLIRAWAKVFVTLTAHKALTPPVVATALVPAMEVICFSKTKQLFSFYREYTQNVIYRGGKIIVNGASKQAVRQLILSTFVNDAVRKAFLMASPSQGKQKVAVGFSLERLGYEAAAEYLTTFQQKAIEHLKRDWRFLDVKPEDKSYLEERVDSKDNDKIKEFHTRIAEIAEKMVDKAKAVLANVLTVKASELAVSVSGQNEDLIETESE